MFRLTEPLRLKGGSEVRWTKGSVSESEAEKDGSTRRRTVPGLGLSDSNIDTVYLRY